jgi:hypothetical protein
VQVGRDGGAVDLEAGGEFVDGLSGLLTVDELCDLTR